MDTCNIMLQIYKLNFLQISMNLSREYTLRKLQINKSNVLLQILSPEWYECCWECDKAKNSQNLMMLLYQNISRTQNFLCPVKVRIKSFSYTYYFLKEKFQGLTTAEFT